MVDEDGFVGPAGMLDRISRNVTRRVPIELNLEKICTALAHPTIRRVLGVFGFKFQQYKGHGDRFYHKSSGQQFWMHRIGSSINERPLPIAGYDDERVQFEQVRSAVLTALSALEIYRYRPFLPPSLPHSLAHSLFHLLFRPLGHYSLAHRRGCPPATAVAVAVAVVAVAAAAAAVRVSH